MSLGRGVVKSWASIVDENALDQAKAISRVPIVTEHLALMPDAHFGFGSVRTQTTGHCYRRADQRRGEDCP